jgi:hypothetical protein
MAPDELLDFTSRLLPRCSPETRARVVREFGPRVLRMGRAA